MIGASAYPSHLTIARVRAQYLILADHPDPKGLKARLDSAVTANLRQTLASMLGVLCPATDERVWLIRRLDLDVSVNATWDRSRVAKAWGQTLGQSINKVFHEATDEQAAVCFPSRSAYLARFVVDCAKGWAWGRWYYSTFEGLRLLPTSAAIRTAILDDTEIGLSALHHLTSSELDTVLSSLTEQDARLLLEVLARSGSPADHMSAFRSARAAWQDRRQWHGDTNTWGATLGLFIAASRSAPSLVGPALLQTSRALVHLAWRLHQYSHADRLVSALVSGDVAILYTVAGAADGETLSPFLRCPPEWVQEVARALRGRHSSTFVAQADTEVAVRRTPFGGLFLLLPLLDGISLDEATEGWTGIDHLSAATIVRCLLFVKCCGQMRAPLVFNDPVVRDIFRIPPTCTTDSLLRWQRRVTPVQLSTFSGICSRWQRERQLAPSSHYFLTTVASQKRRAVVFIESGRGMWLSAQRLDRTNLARILGAITACVSSDDRREATLWCDPVLIQGAPSQGEWQHVLSLRSDDIQTLAEQEAAVAEMTTQVERLAEEMCYLEFPKSFRIRQTLDLALTVIAHGLLRSFAGGLPGYGHSRLVYLYQNFLDCSATLERGAHPAGRPTWARTASAHVEFDGIEPCHLYRFLAG